MMSELIQRRIVLTGYLVQILSTLLLFGFPPVFLLSLLYPLASLAFIKQRWLLTHCKWQLVTSIVAIALAAIATALLAVGLSEINQETTTAGLASSITSVAFWVTIPAWLLYRYVRGLVSFGAQKEFRRLLP